MSFLLVDDKFHAHKKARRAGAEALGLWVLCGSHAAGMEAGGFLEVDEVEAIALAVRFKEWKRAAAKLVEVGLWDAVGQDFQIHDFDHYRKGADREQIRREKDAERKRQKRERERLSADMSEDASADAVHTSPTTQKVASSDAPSRARAPVHSVPFSPAPSCLDPSRAAPLPDPGEASAARREIQTPPLDPHTQARIAYTEAVSSAVGRLWPGIAGFPEEDASIACLLADATRDHTEAFGALDLPRFLDKLGENVTRWVREERAAGREKFTRGWRPSKFVEWMAAQDGAPPAQAPQESRWGPPTDAELGLAPAKPATGRVGAPDQRVDA